MPQQESSSSSKVVRLGKNLSAIQTSPEDFAKRKTSVEFDDDLSDALKDTDDDDEDESHRPTPPRRNTSDVGAANVNASKWTPSESAVPGGKLPAGEDSNLTTYMGGYQESLNSASLSESYGTEESYRDLSQYYVDPKDVRRLVRKFRNMCKGSPSKGWSSKIDDEEDAKKAFALFEMRSRVMETDIERGLERRGGTVPVDDIIITPWYRASHRIRDAVIVSKAWRDGATPRDVVTANELTRKRQVARYVRRRVDRSGHRVLPTCSSPTRRPYITRLPSGEVAHFEWEEVRWYDDADFTLMRCPGLGPRNMRGFEMFTVGDCQSVLLKLTHERCMVSPSWFINYVD